MFNTPGEFCRRPPRKASRRYHPELKTMLRDQAGVTRRLQALWALDVTGGMCRVAHRTAEIRAGLRGWAVPIAGGGSQPLDHRPHQVCSNGGGRSVGLGATGPGLWVAAIIRHTPWPASLVSHAEDNSDANVPSWTGMASTTRRFDPARFLGLIARRVADCARLAPPVGPESRRLAIRGWNLTNCSQDQLDILQGIHEATAIRPTYARKLARGLS